MTPLAKRLAIAVAISLGLNLLLGGVLVGQALQRKRAHFERGGPTPSGVHERGPRRPGAFQRSVGKHHPELGERRRVMETARQKVREALTREPFDKAALEQALAGLRKETEESQALAHAALVETAASATPAVRGELGREFQLGKGKRR